MSTPATTPRTIVRAWAEAFNARDAQAIGRLYAEDAINHQVAEEPERGRAAIAESFARLFAAFPDIGFETVNLFEDGAWAILEWRGGGTQTGAFAGHPPTGRSYELLGSGFFEVKDGRIVHQRGYWDKASWFAQLGIAF